MQQATSLTFFSKSAFDEVPCQTYLISIILLIFSSPHMQDKSVDIFPAHKHTSTTNSLSSHQSELDFKQLPALKQLFVHWIRSLPMEERFVAVKVHAPRLPHTLKALFRQKDLFTPSRNLENQTSRLDMTLYGECNEQKKIASKFEKNVFDSLVFVSDGHHYLDNICFDYSLLECPDRLFDLLTCNVKRTEVKLVEQAINSKRNARNICDLLLGLKCKDIIAEQMLNFMREAVLLNFRNCLNESQIIAKRLEDEKQRKKQFSIYWRNLPEQEKQCILLLDCKDVMGLGYYLKEKGITLSFDQIEKEIQQLLTLQKNQFCNRIFKCKFKKVLHPISDYYQLVYLSWKKDVQRNRRKRISKYHRAEREYSCKQKRGNKSKSQRAKQKNQKSISDQSNETNETEHQLNLAGKQISRYQNNQFADFQEKEKLGIIGQTKSFNQIKDGEYIKDYSEINVQSKSRVKEKKTEIVKNRKQQKNIELLKNPQQISFTSKDSLQIDPPPPITKLKQQVNITNCQLHFNNQVPPPKTISKQLIRKANFCKLAEQLQQITDKISQQANQYHERRIIAFQRIQYLLQYYSIPIKLFGSCANGIAVKNSDIDIAIDKSIFQWMEFIPESQKVRVSLEKLEQLFQNYPCFNNIKVIKTAAIPVMKMTIDTSLPFLQPEFGQAFFTLNRTHNSGIIHADITIETFDQQNQSSHLGIRTTNTINKWLAQIKTLHKIVIIMKEFFAINRLNLAYQGGLNTFAVIVMLVAYITDHGLENQQNTAFVLKEILYFYSQEFNEKERGIDLLNSNKEGIFYQKKRGSESPKLMKADLQLRDPICQSKNMTRNCYLYLEIKKMFKDMLECFFEGQNQLLTLIESSPTITSDNIIQVNRQTFINRNLFLNLHQLRQINS